MKDGGVGGFIETIWPGLGLVVVVTGVAVALAALTGFPVILLALGAGLGASPVYRRLPRTDAGVDWAADPLMKASVAGLGAGVDLMLLSALGWPVLSSILVAMGLTFATGRFLARRLGTASGLAVLASGAVAICGSSAALALCCTLPKQERRVRDLSLIIITVSLLSSAGLVAYPLLTHVLGLGDISTGLVLGGSLHNVAQAVAAGYSVSETAGDTATLVKMARVTLLAPIVMLTAFAFRKARDQDKTDEGGTDDIRRLSVRPPLFLIVFVALMVCGTVGVIPTATSEMIVTGARAGLVLSMAAIGLATPKLQFGHSERVVLLTMTILSGVMLATVCGAALLLDLDA